MDGMGLYRITTREAILLIRRSDHVIRCHIGMSHGRRLLLDQGIQLTCSYTYLLITVFRLTLHESPF